ncbi:hypothetical protein PHISCL_03765 [Aspergillus sclerotialis]|uniref:Sex determining protein n=1 Tax=Aspergillus sclerotialis TaxID=2070753 RepID=A0A3A3A3G9_9EURO|nr:hypothetical protein PHISCL_03765 [Aspergillus sclerotialis]
MYSWHGTNNRNPNPPPGAHGRAGPVPSTSTFAVQQQQQQLRWLPSVMPGSQNPQQQVSPNLHMGMSRNPDHQSMTVTVENRPESSDTSDTDQDSSPGNNGRVTGGMNASGNSDYAPQTISHGRGRSGVSAGGGGVGGNMMRGMGRPMMGELDLDGPDVGGDNTPRKHGKRLTTKEEVTLFDICNRHAPDFGQRSNLCKWWMTVTEEFTQEQGHPYSWHSVRRKVEMVTKQRIKFLEEQRDKGGSSEDLSNPEWRATVDAWIPTWRRWEEAEAKRIERRDSRKPRKRKDRSWETTESVSDSWTQSASPAMGNNNNNSYSPPAATTAVASAVQQPVTALPPTSKPVKLPPGFESMFPNQTPTPASRAGVHPQAPNTYQDSSTTTPRMDNNVMTAMLETLNKLNKRLDSGQPNPRASPVISALVSNSDSPSQSHGAPSNQTQDDRLTTNISSSTGQDIVSKLKEELRQEMRAELRRELEKDRASLEEKLDSVQRTQDMILEMLRQEPN